MGRDPGVDAMMLAKIQELKEAARASTQQPKAHAKKKRKAKRKAGRKGRRGKRK